MKKEKTMKNQQIKESKFDRLMSAITFAEAGEFETAREFLRTPQKAEKRAVKRQERPVKRA